MTALTQWLVHLKLKSHVQVHLAPPVNYKLLMTALTMINKFIEKNAEITSLHIPDKNVLASQLNGFGN